MLFVHFSSNFIYYLMHAFLFHISEVFALSQSIYTDSNWDIMSVFAASLSTYLHSNWDILVEPSQTVIAVVMSRVRSRKRFLLQNKPGRE